MPKKAIAKWDGVYKQSDREGYVISWKDWQGRRRRRTVKVDTQAEALSVLAQEKHRVEEARKFGKPLPADDDFEVFADQFLRHQKGRIADYVAKNHLSKAEYVRQEGIVEQHLKPFFKGMRLAAVRQSDVARYINKRMGEGTADGTLIKEVGVLKRLFSIAVDLEKIAASPAVKLRKYLPQAPEGRNNYLTPDQLGRVLRECPEWMRPVVGLSVTLGTRRGELLAARWEDVDLKAGTITLLKTKSGKKRAVHINDLARQVFASMSAGQKKPRGLLFPDIDPAKLSVYFIRACKKAGVDGVSFHSLRHTYASLLVMGGASLYDVQRLLGHADQRMTGVYAHLSPTHLDTTVKRLDSVLSLNPAPADSEG